MTSRRTDLGRELYGLSASESAPHERLSAIVLPEK